MTGPILMTARIDPQWRQAIAARIARQDVLPEAS
jgi:hypothetical protein